MSITFQKLEYDPGDKRTCGSIEFEATTPKGKMTASFSINSGGECEEWDGEKSGIFLEGKKLDVGFDPGLAHYYGGRAFERCQENLEEYVTEAIEDVLKEIE